jgi:hypothetical protein
MAAPMTATITPILLIQSAVSRAQSGYISRQGGPNRVRTPVGGR